MNSMNLFGSSGIRRLYSPGLLELAFRVGMAVGADSKDVIIAVDTRTSSSAMKHAVSAGLLAAGAGCYDAGIAPTPLLAFAARKHQAGVMITASHNPPEYNGIKLFNPDGSSFIDSQQTEIEELLNQDIPGAAWNDVGREEKSEDVISDYLQQIVPDLPRLHGVRVVVDAGGGAASLVTPPLLEQMGCEVIRLHCRHTGFFPRPSEPVAENLEALRKTVVETGALLGIAHDCDADRMMAVDEKGCFITGDQLLCLFASSSGVHDIVTTVDATMAVDELGKQVRRTGIGDTRVSAELRKGGDLGAETAGGWIFPTVSLCPDGVYAAAVITALAAEKLLSERIAALPSYPLLRGNYPGQIEDLNRVEQRLLALNPAHIDYTDGLKLLFPDGWLLVRSSGTEPRIRLTAEATTEQRARELYSAAMEAVKETSAGGGSVS